MKNIYLIRHGRTEYNILGKYQGISDISLNEIGEIQSKKLVNYFKDIKIDKIFISNLKRTNETIKYLSDYKNIQPEIIEGLNELNGGYFEGKTDSELIPLYANEVNNLRHNLPMFNPPNGESSKKAYERIIKTISEIVTKTDYKNIIIVSHGLVLMLFLGYISNIPFDKIEHIYLENTSVSKICFNNNKFDIEYINDFKHLSKNDII